MNRGRKSAAAIALILAVPVCAQDKAVLRDDGVGMSYEEVEQVVARWPAEMQRAAAADYGDRLELLNKALTQKKLVREAETTLKEEAPQEYWALELQKRAMFERKMVDYHISRLEIPDMTALAKERYVAEKDKYAFIAEQRLSAHILILCGKENCDREEKRALAESVRTRLAAGDDFAELVAEYSEDPGSRDKGGLFDRWLKEGEKDVAKEYVKAVFELEEKGDYSPVVKTRFGFHIIRLQDIKEPYYRPYEEVEERIIKDLENDYAKQAMLAYVRSFKIGDEAYIDHESMERIFSKYLPGAAE